MYLSQLIIENFRCFGADDKRFEITLNPGLTALVGENDSGKTAVIDALRIVLGTTDQDWFQRLEDSDFHAEDKSREIKIVCKFMGLKDQDTRAFVEYLTYYKEAMDKPVLYVTWTAKDTGEEYNHRPYRRVEVRSGKNGDGPSLAANVRELLRATYLRPLRDAEQALSAGRASRLSQILRNSSQITTEGAEFDDALFKKDNIKREVLTTLSVLGIGDLADALLAQQNGVASTRCAIDKYLEKLSLAADDIRSSVTVSGTQAGDDVRRRQLLEKLDLSLGGAGKLGLGSNNLLFMACELLLLAQGDVGNRLLLIEEPEAHLHAQRQLRVMKYLQKQAQEKDVQVIVTTHSPNLASTIELGNMVMISNGRAFPMAKGQTKLESSDYRFLERFLDATKANLFFAHGVMIVEGDSENILLPTLAGLVGRDFTEHGVSIVNVGSVGLRRYARIFLRKNDEEGGLLDISVACVTDMDVMPDCAPAVIGKIKEGDAWPTARRGWKSKKDIGDETELAKHREGKKAEASGQKVKTFVSDEWTLEYDLALGPKNTEGHFTGGLAKEVYIAACLAKADGAINENKKTFNDVAERAVGEFADLKEKAESKDGCSSEEVLASQVYAKFVKDRVSKPVAAQYLANLLLCKVAKDKLDAEGFRKLLPTYLTSAIDYVTRRDAQPETSDFKEDSNE